MTDITPEALEALSKKATQGEWEVETDPYGAPFPGIVYPGSPFEFASFTAGEDADENQANAELCVALVNLFRTGQLILAQPSEDEVEAVARAVAEYQIGVGLPSDDAWEDAHGIATAAIARLDAVRVRQ